MKYRLLSGEDLDVPEPSGELAAFIRRVREAVNDPRVSENDLTALIYGSENPLLDQTIFRDRGAVTKVVFADPTYHMLLDLLGQKRVQEGTLDLDKAEARYTMTVPEAAVQLGIHESAVRQAIASKRLSSWKRDGRHFLSPEEVANYEPGGQGPSAKEPLGKPLNVRLGSALFPGNDAGVSFRVKRREGDVLENEGANTWEGKLTNWRRIGVIAGTKDKARFWAIEPGDEFQTIEWEGFFVRGRFTIVERENNTIRARNRFKAFRAE